MNIDYELVNGGYYITRDGDRWFFRAVTQSGNYDRKVTERVAKKDVNHVLHGLGKPPKYDESDIGSHREDIFSKVERIDLELDNVKLNAVTIEQVEEKVEEKIEQKEIVTQNELSEVVTSLQEKIQELEEVIEDGPINTPVGPPIILTPISSSDTFIANGADPGGIIDENTVYYTTNSTWGHVGLAIPKDVTKDYILVTSVTNNSPQNAAAARIMLGYGYQGMTVIAKNGTVLKEIGQIAGNGGKYEGVIKFKAGTDGSGYNLVTPGFFTNTDDIEITLMQRIYDVTGISEENLESVNWDDPKIQEKLRVEYAEKSGIAEKIEYKGSAWKGKTWLSLGDSISSPNTYQQLVKEQLGFGRIINKAVAGIGMDAMLNNVTDEDINSADLITIYGALNHMYPNAPSIEDFSDELKELVESIFTIKPTARLVIIGTHNAADEYRPPIYQPIRDGKNIGDYVLAMGEVSRYYGCPFIDMYGKCGFNAFNLSTYTTDGAHLNSLGYKRLAEVIVGELQRIEPIQ